MIDFHSHILPGIDDGSKSVSESLELIKKETEQGVTGIALTPHFYAEKDDKNYLQRRKQSFEELTEAISGIGPDDEIRFVLGAEVCFFPGCSKAEIMDELTLGNSRYLLLEMPFSQWDRNVVTEVISLIEDRNIIPVLAHIERYYQFQRNKAFWNEISDMDVVTQMNAGAFTGDLFKRMRNFRILKKSAGVVMGSDCHSVHRRPPNLMEGRNAIEKHFGKAFLEDVDKRSSDLFDEMI